MRIFHKHCSHFGYLKKVEMKVLERRWTIGVGYTNHDQLIVRSMIMINRSLMMISVNGHDHNHDTSP